MGCCRRRAGSGDGWASEQQPGGQHRDDRHDHEVGERHLHHPSVAQHDQRSQRGRQEEEERSLSVGRGDRGDVGPRVDRDREELELLRADEARLVGRRSLVDEHRSHEDVVADRAQDAARRVERQLLPLRLLTERELDHGSEELLCRDDVHDAEEHDEQRAEGEAGGEGLADLVLLIDAGEGRRENDQEEPQDTDLRQVEGQADDEHDRADGLHRQLDHVRLRPILRLFARFPLQESTHRCRHRRSISEHLVLLHEEDRGQPREEGWTGDGEHVDEEPEERPVLGVLRRQRRLHHMRDQEVLRLADFREHAAQHRPDGRVHDKRPHERPELLELDVVVDVLLAPVRVVGGVERDADGDDDRDDRERVEKRAEHGTSDRKRQRHRDLVGQREKHGPEDHLQPVLQEVHAGHDEHEEHDHREVVVGLVVHPLRRRELQHERLDHEEPAGEQRIGRKGHRQEEDELRDHRPPRHERSRREQQQGVQDQDVDHRLLVPRRGHTEEQLEGRLGVGRRGLRAPRLLLKNCRHGHYSLGPRPCLGDTPRLLYSSSSTPSTNLLPSRYSAFCTKTKSPRMAPVMRPKIRPLTP